MRKTAAGLLKAFVLLAFSFFTIFFIYLHLPIIFLENRTCILVHPNENFNEFLQDLKQKMPQVSKLTLKIYSKVNRIDRHLIAGEYCFSDHATIAHVLHKIAYGERERHQFTIIDGWNYQELINNLAQAPLVYDTTLLNNPTAIAIALNLQEDKLEGQFFPDTYFYAYPDSVIDILLRAHQLMQKKLIAYYQETVADHYYNNPYELLITASIIEKESADPEDQKKIAGVIINRLKKNMRLQMDPTVIYGLNDRNQIALSRQDLKINTAYNTYLHSGLPPTPICLPGETALYAAAHPKITNYLFYVSKKTGEHQFSETFQEHHLAIENFLLHRKKGEKENGH